MRVTKKIFTPAAAKKKKKKKKKKNLHLKNYSNNKFSYTFDLCRRVGDKKNFTRPISENKTAFFWPYSNHSDFKV